MSKVAQAATGGPGAGRTSPLVSVVVAAFNAADFIEETCRSVIQQTYNVLELIVVDDGSTDGTGDIVLALVRSDPRVRVIRQPNGGVAAARNAGIAAASGEFIAILDADDLWDPTKIERQLQRLQEAGAGAGFAYCWWAWVDVNGLVLDRSPRWRVEGDVLEKLVEINFTGNTSVPLFRRSCVEEVGGYDVTLRERGYQGSEDWDLALRVAERHSVVVVPSVLVAYRRRGEGMSAACDTMWRSRGLVVEALMARRPSLPREVIHQSEAQYALYLAGVAFWSRRYFEACRWALHSGSATLAFQVAPYLARTLARSFLPGGSFRPVLTAGDAMHDEARLPEPLVPYDRIYGRLWSRRTSA